MSDSRNNYTEETGLLFKLLQTEAFRFILVQFNHYALRERLVRDLKEYFPDRPQAFVDAKRTDYRALMNAYYLLGKGICFIDNFEEVLSNPELYTGLNIRRDKLAEYPIALVCFLSPASRSDWGGDAMEKMPDLWSFRSLILNLQMDIKPPPTRSAENMPRGEYDSSSLGGSTFEEKQQELDHLKQQVSSLDETETALKESLYEQIMRLQVSLRQYDDAIHTIEDSLIIGSTDPIDQAVKISMRAFVYFKQGRTDEALSGFHGALSSFLQIRPHHLQTALIYEQLGKTYFLKGEEQKAESFFVQASNLFRSLSVDSPKDNRLLERHARALDELAGFYYLMKEPEKALPLIDEAIISANRLLELYPNNKRALSILFHSYGTQGILYQDKGEIHKAIEANRHFSDSATQLVALEPSLENISTLAYAMGRLGDTYQSIQDDERGLDYYTQAYSLYKQVLKDGSESSADIRSYADICVRLSRILSEQHDQKTAMDYLNETGLIVEEYSAGFPDEDVSEALAWLNDEKQTILATGTGIV